jgi:hypothetical protein
MLFNTTRSRFPKLGAIWTARDDAQSRLFSGEEGVDCEMMAVASMLVLALSSAAALQLPQAPASSVRRRSPPPSLNEAMTKDRIEKMIADNKVSRRVRTAASLVRRHR